MENLKIKWHKRSQIQFDESCYLSLYRNESLYCSHSRYNDEMQLIVRNTASRSGFASRSVHSERTIRPFTVHRKNSLFFSSEEGVETALTFFTLIETCKNVGLNARDYIATAIRLLMNENENYENLVPMSMAV